MTENKKSFIEEIESDDNDEFIVEINNTSTFIKSEEIVKILQNIYDPEISHSIYDLGLIYKISISDESIDIVMTLTTVNCPEAQSIPASVKEALEEGYPDQKVSVEIVFEPPWTVDNMHQGIKLSLGLL